MNKKELTKIVMMISNWKKPFIIDSYFFVYFHPLDVVGRCSETQLQQD